MKRYIHDATHGILKEREDGELVAHADAMAALDEARELAKYWKNRAELAEKRLDK